MRQQLKAMLRGEKHKSNAQAVRPISGSPSSIPQSADIPSGYDFLSNGIPSTNRGPARNRPRRRQDRRNTTNLENKRGSIYPLNLNLNIEKPSLDDLRMSFDVGDDRWIVANPAIVQREQEKELAVRRDPAEKEVVGTGELDLATWYRHC